MYLVFVQDTVSCASLGVCVAALTAMLQQRNYLIMLIYCFDRKYLFFFNLFVLFCLFPNKNELLPVFPCSPLVALQAPLFFSVLARELPQFQQQGRLLAKPPPLELSSSTTDQL